MAGSAAKRLTSLFDTEEFLATSSRVRQLARQMNDPRAADVPEAPQEGPLFERIPLLEPEAVEAAKDDLSMLTPETRSDFARDVLGMDIINASIMGHSARESAPEELLEPEALDNVTPLNADPLSHLVFGQNIRDQIDGVMLGALTEDLHNGINIDRGSLSSWLSEVNDAVALTDNKVRKSAEPIVGASKIKYPLLDQACSEFGSRALAAIIRHDAFVKMRVEGFEPDAPSPEAMAAAMPPIGPDVLQNGASAALKSIEEMTPEEQQMAAERQQMEVIQQQLEMMKTQKSERAGRVGRFMTWQLRNEMPNWETDTDLLLQRLPLIGCAFRKTFYSPSRRKMVSMLVDARKMIINRSVKHMSQAPRITEEFELYPYQVRERIASGQWSKDVQTVLDAAETIDKQAPIKFYECHMRYNLDDDMCDEPIVVVYHEETQTVCSVMLDFEPQDANLDPDTMQIVSIEPTPIYTVYQYAPDLEYGSIYGRGLGAMIGDIARQLNSTMQAIMDAVHLANSPGGLIGKNMRLGRGSQGDKLHLQGNRFNYVNSVGGSIRDSIYQFQFPGPPAMMMELFSALRDAALKMAGTHDILSGNAALSNTPATTILALIEQGLTGFSAAYMRIFRAMKNEFGILYALNGRFCEEGHYRKTVDDPKASLADFEKGDHDLSPAAGASAVTDMQRLGSAQLVYDLSKGSPLIDQKKALLNLLKAANIEDPESYIASPDVEAVQRQRFMADLQLRAALAGVMRDEADIGRTQADTRFKHAQSHERLSEAASHQATAETVPAQIDMQERELDHRIKMDRQDVRRSFAPSDPPNAFGDDPNR